MREIEWDGNTITKPGVYKNIPLSVYHGKRDLFDGPSVSKSALKWLLPTHGGSPKAFWGRWSHNPDHIGQDDNRALIFGRATHCLLLGDEVFDGSFVIEPKEYPDDKTGKPKKWNNNANFCKAWNAEMTGAGLSILKADELEMIRRMAADAAQYPLIRDVGILNGAVERTMCFKDPATGIWVKARPDVMAADGFFADLKTAAKLDEDFLERQVFEAGYYLQAAMTRMVCRALNIPFETFVLVYVLKDEVPDTAHAEIDDFDIDRGERLVRWSLDTIRACLNAGEWPGARPFNDGTSRVKVKPWAAERIDRFIEENTIQKGNAA
jgi:hypothetical protein